MCHKVDSHASGSVALKTNFYGPLVIAKRNLKTNSCLRGANLIFSAFWSIWTLIGECSSIKYLLIGIYFNNFILQVLAYVEKLQSNEKKN